MLKASQSAQSSHPGLDDRERTLAGILKVGAVISGVMLVTTPFSRTGLLNGVLLYGPGVILHLAHLYWLRRGPVQVVAVSHCLSYFVWVTMVLAFWVGGLGAQAAVVYPPLIVMAALAWSSEGALGLAALI